MYLSEETKSKLYTQTLIPCIPPAESNNIADYEFDEYEELRYTDDGDDDPEHVNIISDLASVTDMDWLQTLSFCLSWGI